MSGGGFMGGGIGGNGNTGGARGDDGFGGGQTHSHCWYVGASAGGGVGGGGGGGGGCLTMTGAVGWLMLAQALGGGGIGYFMTFHGAFWIAS